MNLSFTASSSDIEKAESSNQNENVNIASESNNETSFVALQPSFIDSTNYLKSSPSDNIDDNNNIDLGHHNNTFINVDYIRSSINVCIT